MVNKTMIHETVIRDIADVASDARRIADGSLEPNRPSSRRSFSSISKASQGLTMVFPLLVDRSLSIETATMIAKAKERKCVTMLQMLFSAICITSSKDGFDHISKVHKNLDLGRMNVDDFMVYMDNLIEEGAIKVIDQKKYQAVIEDFKTMEFPMTDPINENSLESFKVHHNADGIRVVQEIFGSAFTPSQANSLSNNVTHIRGSLHRLTNQRQAAHDADVARNYKDLTTAQKNLNDLLQNQLLDSDTRKANEIVPTMMIVRFVSTSPDSSAPITEEIVVGVKVKIYPIDTQDVINRITIKNEDKNGLLKFIKATTRETSFLKDLLFAIDKAKIDALSQSRRGSSSKLWKVLERRSTKSKIRRFFFMNNDASAISSLAISKETAEYLKKMEGIDIMNPRTTLQITTAYNLISLVIADETLEVCDWYWDGDNLFERVSFNALEREASDNSYKKVINLMTKMAR